MMLEFELKISSLVTQRHGHLIMDGLFKSRFPIQLPANVPGKGVGDDLVIHVEDLDEVPSS